MLHKQVLTSNILASVVGKFYMKLHWKGTSRSRQNSSLRRTLKTGPLNSQKPYIMVSAFRISSQFYQLLYIEYIM